MTKPLGPCPAIDGHSGYGCFLPSGHAGEHQYYRAAPTEPPPRRVTRTDFAFAALKLEQDRDFAEYQRVAADLANDLSVEARLAGQRKLSDNALRSTRQVVLSELYGAIRARARALDQLTALVAKEKKG